LHAPASLMALSGGNSVFHSVCQAVAAVVPLPFVIPHSHITTNALLVSMQTQQGCRPQDNSTTCSHTRLDAHAITYTHSHACLHAGVMVRCAEPNSSRCSGTCHSHLLCTRCQPPQHSAAKIPLGSANKPQLPDHRQWLHHVSFLLRVSLSKFQSKS